MGLTPLTFTGISDFSSDFQTILDRARQISQIPVQQLTNKDSDILQKKTLLGGLSTGVSALAASLSALGATAANKALSASSSNSSKVTVTNSGASQPTTYTIDSITSVAAAASERSLTGYADSGVTPVSLNGSLKLVVGGHDYPLTLSANTLVGLRDKINSLGAGVAASILTTSDGNYLSVTANTAGHQPITLIDDPDGAATSLLTSTNAGSNAKFSLNGIDIEQASNTVNSVIPGVTFTLQQASDTPVTLTLATDRSQLQAGLQDFVNSYNSLRSQVSGQTGPSAGLLSGDSIIGQVSNILRQISGYQKPGSSFHGLADLGIVFDTNGTASLDTDKFNALSETNVAQAFDFIGSATTGLGEFATQLTQISDPVTGLIRVTQQGYERTDQNLQNQIAILNDRITVQQNALAARLHAADALLASLASQQKTLTASLQGLSLTLFGKNSNS